MTTICFVCREGVGSSRIVRDNYEKYLQRNDIIDIQTTASGTRQGNPFETQIQTMNEAGYLDCFTRSGNCVSIKRTRRN